MREKHVIVLPYDKSWKINFGKIKEELLEAIENTILGIEHIGSTSVEGLSAKPIIDIDVVIKDYSVFDIVKEKLMLIGYIHVGDLEIKNREAFKYIGKEHLQQHHLYVCLQNSVELIRHITFRNYLRSNQGAVIEYGHVKEEAARLFPEDIDKYMEYKSPYIEILYKKCGL